MSHDEAIHSRGTPHNEIAITSRASSAYNIRVGNGQHASPPHVVQVYNKVIASMISECSRVRYILFWLVEPHRVSDVRCHISDGESGITSTTNPWIV